MGSESALLMRAFELAPVSLLTVDESGTILAVNPAAEQMLGARAEELVGRPVDVLVPRRSRHRHARELEAYMKEPRVRAIGAGRSLSVLCRDGSELPVEVGLTPVKSPDGPVVVVSLFERMGRVADTADGGVSESPSELAQLLRVIGHDMQEPLRMVTSFTGLLSRDYADSLDRDAREYIDLARDGAHRMQHMLRDLVTYLRLSRPAPRRAVDVTSVAERAVEKLSGELERVSAEIRLPPLPIVVAVEEQLEVLFEELIANATRFRGATAPRITIAATAELDHWVFSVGDNGVGIAAEHWEAVFELFRRLHPREAGSGRGVGLAMCKRIVELHGGAIWLQSQPEHGTTVYFTLPRNT